MTAHSRIPAVIVCLLALLGGALAVSSPAPAYAAPNPNYRPIEGGHFNNPYGTVLQQNRIENQIVRAIKRSKRTSTIRITAFSLDRMRVARALVAAKRRGVRVQILLNDHQFTPAMGYLRGNGFRADTRRKNWMRQCVTGCRGGGYLHTKMYLFRQTGAAQFTVMVGSANLTTNAVAHQWNDLYVRNDDRELYAAYNKVFRQMARDRQARPTYLKFKIRDDYTLFVLPPTRPTRAYDPIIRILRKVQCTGAATRTGRTQIRISQHHWSDRRGAWIARRVVKLWEQGCNIKIMHGSADKFVRPELNRPTPRGPVPARSNGFDLDQDTFLDVYSHQKYMTIRGNYDGDPDAWVTMTGSSNWASLGVHGDENILLINGKDTLRQWRSNFNLIWQRYSKPVVYRPRSAAGAQLVPIPQPRTGGRHWEGD